MTGQIGGADTVDDLSRGGVDLRDGGAEQVSHAGTKLDGLIGGARIVAEDRLRAEGAGGGGGGETE